jgi:hypothetical protein
MAIPIAGATDAYIRPSRLSVGVRLIERVPVRAEVWGSIPAAGWPPVQGLREEAKMV